MTGKSPAIRNQSEMIQQEHQELLRRLADLDSALEAIVCYSEVYANLASCADVIKAGRWLSGWLPPHFLREEEGVLKALAKLGPDMAKFAAEMKRQHREIAERVQKFCQVAAGLEQAADLQDSICDLKQAGKELTGFMAAHMGAEERKLRSLEP